MAKYRKVPVVIDAWPSDSTGFSEDGTGVKAFHDISANRHSVYDELHDTWVKYEPGDWVIKGVAGEFYPCKPEVFDKTYEYADNDGD